MTAALKAAPTTDYGAKKFLWASQTHLLAQELQFNVAAGTYAIARRPRRRIGSEEHVLHATAIKNSRVPVNV